jgi:hypothetical protein
LHITGRVKRAPAGTQAILEALIGKRWRVQARAKVRRGRFSIFLAIPGSRTGASESVRVALVAHGRRLRVSAVRQLRVSPVRRLGVLGGSGVLGSSTTRPSSSPPPAGGPLVVPEVSTGPLTLPPGSRALVPSLGPLETVSAIDAPSPEAQGVRLVVANGTLSVETDKLAVPGTRSFSFGAEGCTSSACNVRVLVRITVVVRPLAAPPGSLEGFTSPSEERISSGSPLGNGAVELPDELYITLGTPDVVGTRGEAEADAAAVGGVVAGGLEQVGVYEIRWGSAQSLPLRTSELEALGATVGPALPGQTTVSQLPPGDWDDDGPQATWPFTEVHAPEAWNTTVGSDIRVGIIDSGLVYSKHEDLNVVESFSGHVEQHATHVAGLACAKANGIGIVGMAWGCPIVSASIGDQSPTAVLQAAVEVAISGVGVANMSLAYNNGQFCHTAKEQSGLIASAQKFKPAFRHLFQGPLGRDIVWTLAAGNNCAEGVPSPWGLNADLPNVITVGATNDGGELASFSDFGPGVELAAPGGVSAGDVGIWSTWVESCGFESLFTCGAYHTDQGTSMSAPIVAGTAALVREAHPDLGAAEAATCITQSAGEETGWTETRSSHPTFRTPIVHFTGSTDRLPIVNAAAAVVCGTFDSEDPGSYVGTWSGSGWILDMFEEGDGALGGVNQGETSFVNGCVAGPGLQVISETTSTGTGQWDGLIVAVDSTCSEYNFLSPVAMRAIRLGDGEVAIELAWPQEVGGALPEIESDGSVVAASAYFNIWLYRPGSEAYLIHAADHSAARAPRAAPGASGVPLPGAARAGGG